jgi:hypothetical protein
MIKDYTMSEIIKFNKEKQKFMLFRVTRTYNFDELRQEKIGKRPISKVTTWHELSALGDLEPKKAVKVPIIIKKTATDTNSLETLTAFFSQNLEVKVLSDSKYIYQYLTVCENRIFIHNLDSGQTAPLALSGNNQEGTSKEFLGTPKRLTEAEALELIEKGTVLFEKVSEGEYRILV